MSARNSLEAKRARRLRRSLTKGTLPSYVNLIEWVKVRSHLSTGRARKVLMSGALKVDSHPVGYRTVKGKKYLNVLLPAHMAPRIQITDIEDA